MKTYPHTDGTFILAGRKAHRRTEFFMTSEIFEVLFGHRLIWFNVCLSYKEPIGLSCGRVQIVRGSFKNALNHLSLTLEN